MPALLPIAGLRKSASGDKALTYAGYNVGSLEYPQIYEVAINIPNDGRTYNFYNTPILNNKGLIYPTMQNFYYAVRINTDDNGIFNSEDIDYYANISAGDSVVNILNKGDKAYAFDMNLDKIFEFTDGGDFWHELDTSPFSLANTKVYGFDGNDDLSQYLISHNNGYYEKYNSSTFTHTPSKFLEVHYSNGMYLLSNAAKIIPNIMPKNENILYDYDFNTYYKNGDTPTVKTPILCLHEANTTIFTELTLPFYCLNSTIIKFDWPKCIIGPVVKPDEYEANNRIYIYIAITKDGFNTFSYKQIPIYHRVGDASFEISIRYRNWLIVGAGKNFILLNIDYCTFFYTNDEFNTIVYEDEIYITYDPSKPGYIGGTKSDVYYYNTYDSLYIHHFKFR
jgi:hypothetical protein